jgi:hypothetical protein
MAQDYKAKAAAIEVDSKSALSITVIQNILLTTNEPGSAGASLAI